ncbi:hypothetical protein NQ315_010860 [Exocentrus adspersus]|uniref:Transposase n=1 Tax=Exocentrus adspersus TaxID=1586481 RepID=A0AAV8VBB7_9CUCU|nr:hypothetical protein NQ315_010860 [Exocentrus adspersus]
MTQPLDVAFFRPLKGAWRKILEKWKMREGKKAASIPKDKFPHMLKELMMKIEDNKAANVKAGFRKSGIYPLNRHEVFSRLPQMSDEIEATEAAEHVSRAVVEVLKDLRYSTTPNTQRKRKKIVVTAGKSVIGADFQAEEEEEIDQESDVESNDSNTLEIMESEEGHVPENCRAKGFDREVELVSDDEEIPLARLKKQKGSSASYKSRHFDNNELDEVAQEWNFHRIPKSFTKLYFTYRQTIHYLVIFHLDKKMNFRKVTMDRSINSQIIKKLHDDASKMKHLKYCILMLDEMSLEAALTYKKNEDFIDGLEHIVEIKQKFADHVMVFMLRGLAKTWKQPISYYFMQSAMKSVEVAAKLKVIIRAVHTTVLKIIATVCDQFNSAAINRLNTESRQEFIRKGTEYKSRGFYVDNNEIIPIYDTPHLLKGIRNSLMKYRFCFKWKKDNQIASWKHVVNFYELDSGDYDMKMCNKLTDSHIYENKMKKMKE